MESSNINYNNFEGYNIDMIVSVFSGLFLNIIQEKYQDDWKLVPSAKILIMFLTNIIVSFVLYIGFLYLAGKGLADMEYKKLLINTILSILSNQYSHQAITKRFTKIDTRINQ